MYARWEEECEYRDNYAYTEKALNKRSAVAQAETKYLNWKGGGGGGGGEMAHVCMQSCYAFE